MKKKITIIITLMLLFMSFICVSNCKKGNMSIVAEHIDFDSVSLEVKNNSATDTFFYAIHYQQKFGKIWLTNEFEIFADPDFKILVYDRILPKEAINLRIELPKEIYPSEDRDIVKSAMQDTLDNTLRYRFLLKATCSFENINNPNILIFSNIIEY